MKMSDTSEIITLRGHHIICSLGFEGKGYNKIFIENMSTVLNILKNNPASQVKIIDSYDDICKACPNLGLQGCFSNCDPESESRIKGMDRLVISKLQISEEKSYSWNKILELVSQNFSEEAFEEMCINCKWKNNSNCKNGLLNLKLG